MEHLYNPDLMPDAELRRTFVGRQSLVDELVSLVERQPEGAGVQHVVIVAPRGMGKTTVLLRVQLALGDRGLSSRWHTLRFPEELYGINDLADLWLETLRRLSTDTGDPALQRQAEGLRREHPLPDDLQEVALALIKDWCQREGRRLVLLIDNLDMLLEQMASERESACLRNVLMNEGFIMVLGAATSFFQEAHAYHQPLYNFFRIYHLERLKHEDIETLLRQRAALDGVAGFDDALRSNSSRLRVLEYFTGGNPRLVLMLYRIVAQSDVVEALRALRHLLDQVTPYYKAKTESLPPQQRKILDCIARMSSETHEGQTPTEIAGATRLTASIVSSQLKRLLSLGYVRVANLRGRNSYYTLSEPLYALWYQMRCGRDSRQRMQWLVEFLRSWYDADEVVREGDRLETHFHEMMTQGLAKQARAILEHRRYLAEAIADAAMRQDALEHVVRDGMQTQRPSMVREVLVTLPLDGLSDSVLLQMAEAGHLSAQDARATIRLRMAELEAAGVEAERVLDSIRSQMANGPARALQHCSDALQQHPDSWGLWYARSIALWGRGRYEEALRGLARALSMVAGQTHLAVFAARIQETRLVIALERGMTDVARDAWAQLVAADDLNVGLVLGGLLAALEAGHTTLVSDLVARPGGRHAFFPMVRALDYVRIGDEALVEKLSPEVRGIVEEIAAKLRGVAGLDTDAHARQDARKPRAGSPNRTRKQLH